MTLLFSLFSVFFVNVVVLVPFCCYFFIIFDGGQVKTCSKIYENIFFNLKNRGAGAMGVMQTETRH